MNTSSSTVESSGAPQRIDVAIVGAGFGGMYAVYKFREMGLKIQAFEAGGDLRLDLDLRVRRHQRLARWQGAGQPHPSGCAAPWL